MSISVVPVTMCSAKSLIGDVPVQMVLSLHHRNFHFLFKWSYLSTSILSLSFQMILSLHHQNFQCLFKSPVSPSSKLSLSVQMVLPLHHRNFHFLIKWSCLSIIKISLSKCSLVFHYLPDILRYWHLHWKRDVCWFLKSNT